MRTIFGADKVPEPVRYTVTRWAAEEFSLGSYSYVGIGGSGESYDAMARPVGRSLLFCGEHTSKEHLDTVGGSIKTGLREVCCYALPALLCPASACSLVPFCQSV